MKLCCLTSSVSRLAGGLFEVTRRMAQTLSAQESIDVQVLGLVDAHTAEDMPAWEPLVPHAFPVHGPRRFGYAHALGEEMKHINADIAHVQGLWMYPSVACLTWSRRTGRPYSIAPHGMLDTWALRNSWWKKRFAAWVYQDAHLKGAACLQAGGPAEEQSFRNYGLRNPICIVPNGIDLPLRTTKIKEPTWGHIIESGQKILLYLGRLHSKKGLLNLLQAWAMLQNESVQSKGWHLVIAGWDQDGGGHEVELKKIVAEMNLASRVHFVGPQFGADKQACYNAADGFILPSFSEGLPMVVLEAWSWSLPVLMTAECNLPIGFTTGAAMEIRPDPENIKRKLFDFFSASDTQRQDMGLRGQTLVKEQFSWNKVAADLHKMYHWVLNGGSVPDFVHLK